jgi:hypothetical protein
VVLLIDKWSARTLHQDEAGPNAVWDNIEGMDTAVTGDVLRFKRLNVQVYDKDLSSDTLIGEGDASLRGIGSQSTLPGEPDKLVPISVKLKSKKGKTTGEVKVYASIVETLVKGDPLLDNTDDGSVVEGDLQISKIDAVNIRGGGEH